MAFSAVSPGARRSDTLALADGIRVLLACSMPVASMPIMATAGLVHSRSTTEPDAEELYAVGDAALGPEPVLG